jgi:hypothetical protein
MRNAKIWIMPFAEPVKIKLRPGQTLKWSHYSRDEEGGSFEANEWSWDGERLVSRGYFSGTDCDGRVDRSWEGVTTEKDFQVNSDGIHPEVKYPKWDDVEESQRDYSAEAAGY